VEAMQAIWTQDKASYDGEFVKFDRIFSWPKPVQKPHPPIYVGGDAPGTFKRILSYGDGWIPMLAEQENTFDLKTERMAELATLANEAGRAPYPITTFGTPRDPNAISRLATQGVTRCIFGIKAAPTEDVLPRLDKISRMVSEVRTGDG
jgi:alkanesulfonate monooxygenase SsuD/methylene tetrahydromethanopterin reductase-like flavin-dependent oxidoreductase (luciferase family)